MQDIPFWVMDWVPQDSEDGEPIPTNLRTDSDEVKPEDWYENVIRLQKFFGVPIGYHVYNWHKIPFNNDYPHFLPAKDSFMKGLSEPKQHDIRIMPYINALLWDTKDRGNSDFEFESIGRAGSVKTESGDPIILRFESRETDGKLVELTAMCPSYQKWRDKLVKLTTDMFEELGVDAIYLDQIAARIPHLCMDETHGHPLGGGSWWTQEYNDLLAELNGHKPEGKVFTSESNAEVFASQLDGFLSWAWVRCDNEVPAFMRIYSNVIKVLGRNANGYMKHSDMHWKYHLAQSLLCGQQMGWVNADLINMPERLEFTKKLVQFRYAYREFFRHITILRPPVVQAERAHKFVSDVGMGSAGMIMKPYICSAAMQNGKERMILLINIGKETMTDVMTFNPKEYNPGENFKVEGYGSVNCVSDGKMECAVEGEEGYPTKDVPIGVMVETPAAAVLAHELAKEAAFFSVGTNDLTQYTLAVDRQNAKLGQFYDPYHPALLALMAHIAKAATDNGIWAGICGELGADPKLQEKFIEMGFTELSMAAGRILESRKLVCESEV